MGSGGKREGSGGKKKFGDVPLKVLQRKVPEAKYDEIAEKVDKLLDKYKPKKQRRQS